MAGFAVVGGGMCGSLVAMMLAKDGHEVTVFERDAAGPPSTPDAAWEDWDRQGVAQFRLGHFFLPRFREELQEALPEVVEAIEKMGGLQLNLFGDENTPGWRDGDERYGILTGRRPAVEAEIARLAEATSGLEVHRGSPVGGLVVGIRPGGDGTQSVTGVRLEDGAEHLADMVIDAAGRRSPFPRFLADAGMAAPAEELDDSGFIYYGRTYKSADGTVPGFLGGGLQAYDSVSTLTLPADNGSWFCAFVASSDDKAMRAVRDPEVFERLWGSFPLVAHWLDGEPDGDIKLMAGIEDRIRHFVVDGEPVAPGVLAVGDSWACTNPSVGRGASIGAIHAVALRDLIRTHSLDDPKALALAWDEVTDETVRPWYDDTLTTDRHRLAQIEAEIDGGTLTSDDLHVRAYQLMPSLLLSDPEVMRAYLDTFMVLRTKNEVLADTDLLAKVLETGSDEPLPGPSRSEIEAILTTNATTAA